MGNHQKMRAPNQSENGINLDLLNAAIKFNALILGLTCGTLAALIIFFGTQVSMDKWGVDAGNYLGLLAVFFPGYSVSSGGAWIGALWAFVYAGTFSSLTYWLYGRVLGARIREIRFQADNVGNPVLKPSILRLHGRSLGLAVGTTVALGLFCSTIWLVIRGTAGESVHAALLSNYIPGYSVSIAGGLRGALELFVVVFLACLLLATVYNKLVTLRHKQAN
jgi:hypothetical protein